LVGHRERIARVIQADNSRPLANSIFAKQREPDSVAPVFFSGFNMKNSYQGRMQEFWYFTSQLVVAVQNIATEKITGRRDPFLNAEATPRTTLTN